MSARPPEAYEEAEETPNSRVYVHKRCGTATLVSGDDFRRLVDPFSPVQVTYCASCRKMESLDKVAWSDTGEPIAAFRRRLRDATPRSLLLFNRIAPFVAAVLCAGIGWLFTPHRSLGPLAGGITGLVTLALLANPIGRMFWGVDYRRMK